MSGEKLTIFLCGIWGWRSDYCPGLKDRTVFPNGLGKYGSRPGGLQQSPLNPPSFPNNFPNFQIWEPPFSEHLDTLAMKNRPSCLLFETDVLKETLMPKVEFHWGGNKVSWEE